MKPTKTRWATGDPTYIIQPSASKMDIGWLAGEKPPRQFMNWLFNLIYKWETYYEDKTENIDSFMLRSSGSLSWNGSTGVLTFGSNLDIVFRVTTASHINRIAPGTLTMTDGQVVVVARNRGGVSPVALAQGSYPGLNVGEYDIVNDSSLVATNQENELILFRRNGSTLEIPGLGLIYQDGTTFKLGQFNSDVGSSVPIGTIIPFYDFNGALSFDSTVWAYCDGSTTIVGGVSRTLPDLSNRYLVGFGTEGGGDIDSASWSATAVGNASHQVNLTHSHTVSSHTHDLANHTHTGAAHTHTMANHTHTGAAHTHTMANHTHTGGSHTHGAGTQSFRFGEITGTTNGYLGDATGTLTRIFVQSNLAGGGANPAVIWYDSTARELWTDPTGTTGSTASGGAVATGGPSTNTSDSTTPGAGGTPSTNTSDSTTPGAGGTPSVNTSGAATPGTDSQLSATQSIQPRSIRTRFLMRVA